MQPTRAALILGALLLIAAVRGSAPASAQQQVPVLPEPQPITLDSNTTALLVLDLNARCNDPQQVCHELIPGVGAFLGRARAAGVPVVYTISLSARGTELDGPAQGLEAAPGDIIIYPDGFDKFHDGELERILDERGITTVILTGSSSNMAVLYTGSMAARYYGLRVVVALDGINANTRYEEEFPLHNLMTMSGGASSAFAYTTLDGISFSR